ncbi:MAG TPA: ComEC/Rec2 family competence protein [Candidatus Limnocylindrales bacterium]|nr:ComEC/Rec2 family competence protein [Candidatus Limnocylindrales bacterium]
MGRSSRLATGAIIAAVAAGQVAPGHLAAGVALALAAILLVGATIPRLSARSLLPIALGAALIVLRLALIPAAPTAPDVPPAGRGPWHLIVEAVGSPHDGQQPATLVTRPEDGPRLRLAATLPIYPAVVPGDRVVVDGPIRGRPDSPYGEYLLRIGAVGTLASRTLAVEPASDDLGHRIEGLRRGAGDALTVVLPEPEAGLAAGILIGLRDRVDRDLAAAFTTAGVSHVVAISGWNIAIVAAAMASVTGRLGRRRRSVVTILGIVTYVAFAGASASVVRAALMAAVVLLARETGRAGRAAAALGWAATLLLASDPHLIDDAGFQLSSLATAGLIAWATPITAWIQALGRGRLPGWLAESLGVSLAAQAATLPIILVSFGRLALLSPLVNVAVVPLVAPAMAVGLVALTGGIAALAGAPPIVGAILATPGWVILRILVAVVDAAAALPFASVTLAPPLDVITAACAGAVLLVVSWRRRRSRSMGRSPSPAVQPRPTAPERPNRPAATHGGPHGGRLHRAGVASLVLAVAVTGAVFAARPAGFARVSILDVGQGDAILVEGSRGGRLLVDGGPDPERLLVALDQRIPPWDRRLDAVVLSHPHEDHVAGLALLLERYHVDRVFEPGMRGPGPGYAAWLRDLAAAPALVRLGLAAGDRLAVDEIGLRVLWPIRGQVPALPPDGGTGINNVSVVLLGQVGDRRFLLMGDVEEAIDPSLLADGLPRVDLLKIAHHGSRTATTEAFVEAVRPAVAVASAGSGNPYGHPAKATLDRLAASGARVLRTDLDGTVVIGFEAGGMTVAAEGGRSAAGPSPLRAIEPTTPTATNPGAVAAVRAAPFLCAIPAVAIVPGRVPAPTPASPSPAGRHRAPVAVRDDIDAPLGLPPGLPPSRNASGVARVRRRALG